MSNRPGVPSPSLGSLSRTLTRQLVSSGQLTYLGFFNVGVDGFEP